jgi:hypothetical protein
LVVLMVVRVAVCWMQKKAWLMAAGWDEIFRIPDSIDWPSTVSALRARAAHDDATRTHGQPDAKQLF